MATSGERAGNRLWSRDHLVAICTDEFVRAHSYFADQASFTRIVRSIVLRNIVTGRVAHQLRKQHPQNLERWLAAYVRTVSEHYVHEHDEWLRLFAPQTLEKLYLLLLRFARGHAGRASRMGDPADAYDIAHEALYSCEARLQRYTFDVSLRAWLDRHVRQCADRLLKGRSGQVFAETWDDLDEELVPDTSATSDQAVWDRLIDAHQRIDSLTNSNRVVLQMWCSGYSLRETSLRLRISEKAVSNRRARIRNVLGADSNGVMMRLGQPALMGA